MKKHSNSELIKMLEVNYRSSHKGEILIDVYSFLSKASPVEHVKAIYLAPDTHTIYKETYYIDLDTDIIRYVKIDGIL